MRRAESLVDDPDWSARSSSRPRAATWWAWRRVRADRASRRRGALPAHLWGAGGNVEVVQGDAYFQSAICHLPARPGGAAAARRARPARPAGGAVHLRRDAQPHGHLAGRLPRAGGALPRPAPARRRASPSGSTSASSRHLLARIEKAVGKKVTNDDLNAAVGPRERPPRGAGRPRSPAHPRALARPGLGVRHPGARRRAAHPRRAHRDAARLLRVPQSREAGARRRGARAAHRCVLRGAAHRLPAHPGARRLRRSSPTTCTWACAGSPSRCPPPATRWTTSPTPTCASAPWRRAATRARGAAATSW